MLIYDHMPEITDRIPTELTLAQEQRGVVNGIHVPDDGKVFDSMGRPVNNAQAALAKTRRQLRRSQVTTGGRGRDTLTTVKLGELTLRTSR